MSGPNGLSDRLAEHVCAARFEDLPAPAVEAAKRSLLDAVAVMLGASGLGEGCAAFADLARASGGPGECTLLGQGARAPLLPAVLANGAAAHALDFEDAFDAAPVHPNAPMTPAVLALAEQRGGVSGRELITALAVGCDLVCRLALAVQDEPARQGWYTPPILGAFGAAAACARLLRLSPVQVRDAFSLTLCQATCSAEIKYSERSVVRGVRDGFAAHAGLLAALLAERGVAGFEAPFEGRAGLFTLYARGVVDAEAVTADLGRRFHGAEVSFKPWPSCRGTHPFIDAILGLKAQTGLSADQTVSIETVGGPVQLMLAEPRALKLAPATAIAAKFSIPFTVATALVHGGVELRHFSPHALQDPQVLALAETVTFMQAPEAGSVAASAAAGTTLVRLKDGRTLTRHVEHPRGHPFNPMSWDELEAKLDLCAAAAATPPPQAWRDRFVNSVRRLETADDVAGLLDPCPVIGAAG